jgi:hypothetical protein
MATGCGLRRLLRLMCKESSIRTTAQKAWTGKKVAKTAYEAHRAKVMALPGIPEWKDLNSSAKETWKALAQTMREAYNQVLTSS